MVSMEAESALREIGAQLITARARRGWSARELAKRIGVDRRTLAQLEKGRPTVSVGVFVQALGALDLLRGLEEALKPHNDLEALARDLRRIRSRKSPIRDIADDQVDF